MNASIIKQVEREIQRTKNHLEALELILQDLQDANPRRRLITGNTSRTALVQDALSYVPKGEIFSVKQITAYAKEIDPQIDRRLIYNCIKGYLQTGVKYNEYQQITDTEYKQL